MVILFCVRDTTQAQDNTGQGHGLKGFAVFVLRSRRRTRAAYLLREGHNQWCPLSLVAGLYLKKGLLFNIGLSERNTYQCVWRKMCFSNSASVVVRELRHWEREDLIRVTRWCENRDDLLVLCVVPLQILIMAGYFGASTCYGATVL